MVKFIDFSQNLKGVAQMTTITSHFTRYFPEYEFLPERLKNSELVKRETLQKSNELGLAVVAGNTKNIARKLAQGACPNTRTNRFQGEYLLHIAARKGDVASVQALLNGGANIHAMTFPFPQNTPIQVACIHGHAPVVSLLLENKADIGAKRWDYRQPLSLAIQYKHPEVCRLLMNTGAYDPKTFSLVLPSACKAGKLEIVQLLIGAKANPNGFISRMQRVTALAEAVFSPDIVQFLLEQRADVSAVSFCSPSYQAGSQAIHEAAYFGIAQSVQLLLKAGANPAAQNGLRKTPSQVARARLEEELAAWTHFRHQEPKIVAELRQTIALLEQPVNSIPDEDENTPLISK